MGFKNAPFVSVKTLDFSVDGNGVSIVRAVSTEDLRAPIPLIFVVTFEMFL